MVFMVNLTADQLRQDLKTALSNQEFVLYYQPEYSVSTASFAGVEALIRWQHPRYGLLLPGQFLEFTQETDLINQIGRWVLETAIKQNKKWQDKGLAPMRVGVNVMGSQFDDPDFASFVMKTLKTVGLHPNYLELEIHETTIINDDDFHIIDTIKLLSNAGVKIALDDFGSGYTKVSYISKIPVDRIKIDKSYIDNINTNHNDATIVKAIINFASQLNIQVLAEGIESLNQLSFLTNKKPIDTQGFYFSEPLPAEEIEKFLTKYVPAKKG